MNIVEYKQAIKSVTTWDGDGSVFGFINSGSFTTDYIYEFYCAMEMLNDLAVSHRITIVPGEKGIHFSRKGGYKKNHAKFLIFSLNRDELLFQVCLGTEIYLDNHFPFRADISIQTPNASDTPNQDMIVVIHDAKYSDSKSGISFDDIQKFAMNVLDYELPKSEKEKLVFNKYPFFKLNCLISNSSINILRREYSLERNVRQIGGFFPGTTNIEE